MFLRNAWYVAALDDEVSDKPLARTLLNDAVVLFRDAQGRAAALEDRCRHRGAPLSLGEVTARGLQCGYHGMAFDGQGVCTHIPGQERIPPQARVRAYPVAEHLAGRIHLETLIEIRRKRQIERSRYQYIHASVECPLPRIARSANPKTWERGSTRRTPVGVISLNRSI